MGKMRSSYVLVLACVASVCLALPNTEVQCYAGSPNLCSCSQLIEKHIIKSFDDCTQEAAIAACKSGQCSDSLPIANPNAASECYAGSPSLCGCSQLIEKHIIKSFDDCTQEAAIAACKSGRCKDSLIDEKNSGPCCSTCENGKSKFYSIPDPSAKNAECGECCLQPKFYRFWKVFESKLMPGSCASQGYTTYKSTETDGVPPLAVTNDRYVKPTDVGSGCPQALNAVYADMHDGDKKEVTISGTAVTIKPSGNNQTWVVTTKLDDACTAVIDFNVKGKPSPPPVNLTAALRISASVGTGNTKTEWEFTDPSGTLAAAGYPLNHWVEIKQ